MASQADEGGHPAPTLFVSYRRTDAFAADQLVQALQHAFGEHRVIQDTVSFEPGARFPDEIARHVRDCRLMVVVIGPHWCGSGENNLMSRDDDWVRREVELAIRGGRPLLPVLLAGAQIPKADQLPETMHPLLAHGALELRAGAVALGDLRRIVASARRYMPRDWRRMAGEAAFMGATMAAAGLGGSLVGASALFPDYAAWQWPNVLTGVSVALVLPALAVADHLSRLWAAKWRRPVPLYRRPALQSAGLAGAIVALAAFAWLGTNPNPIDALYSSLESTRAETPRVEELLNTVRSMPRYADGDDVRLVRQIVAVRKKTTLTVDEVNSTANALAPYLAQADARRRLWATLTSAEAYRFVNKHDEQLALYQQIAQNPAATAWQRWYAYQELGAIHYQHKADSVQARRDWEEALKYRKTRGLLQNLAVLDEDEDKWDSAADRYKQAVEVLKAYKNAKQLATLADQEAALHANWCNMRRRQANRVPAADAAALRLDAAELCRKAVAAYFPYLDAHWNLARVQLDGRDFDKADKSLRDALETLRDLAKSDPNSLNRYGYDVYGERYTLWLLVVSRFLSGRPLQSDTALWSDFSRQIVQLRPNAAEAVAALLSEMAKRELTVDEDRVWLAKMSTSNYLLPR